MALAFVDVGVGFADRAAAVVTVGFLSIYGFYILGKILKYFSSFQTSARAHTAVSRATC